MNKWKHENNVLPETINEDIEIIFEELNGYPGVKKTHIN
jgi:hypothetical protein